MKKIYQIIVLCVMGIALASCGGRPSSGTSNEKEHEDYKAACEQGDFQKAYSIVNELKKEMNQYENEHALAVKYDHDEEGAVYRHMKDNYEEAEHYVVLQETTYILENQGIEGLTKITMVVKEHNANWVYKDLFDIAVAMGNDEIAERIKKIAGSEPHRSWATDTW